MDSAAYASVRYSFPAGAGCRLRLALAISVFSHLLFAAAFVSEVPWRGAQIPGAASITVRFDYHDRVVPHGPAVADLDEPPLRRWIDRRTVAAGGEKPATRPSEDSATKPDPTVPLALPLVPDSTVYTARDLDSYPRPVVPLDIGRLSELSAGIALAEARFELLIDEHGIVNEVVPAGAGTADQPGADLRAALAVIRFVPARKDGRAVRSRVLLSVSFGQEQREP